jgi:NADH-quinone oxidoreductase subunit C
LSVPEYRIAPEVLRENIAAALGALAQNVTLALDEVTVIVAPEHYIEAMTALRDAPQCRFDQLLDVCGVDYSAYGSPTYEERTWTGKRFAVVSHLLSVELNQRVRVRVFCDDDELPSVQSLTGLWSAANWYEREAFDLYGIVFEGHNDLRRILTDYGFIGHPFRKDFPISGTVEMRYDAERQRVIYVPVSIEPREITPRVIREDKYAGFQ